MYCIVSKHPSFGRPLKKIILRCGHWRNGKNEIIVVESECLLGGDWSTTRAIAGNTHTYTNKYSWAKPNEVDMKCGCDTITVSGYDPNSEEGADFVCAEPKNFSGQVKICWWGIFCEINQSCFSGN